MENTVATEARGFTSWIFTKLDLHENPNALFGFSWTSIGHPLDVHENPCMQKNPGWGVRWAGFSWKSTLEFVNPPSTVWLGVGSRWIFMKIHEIMDFHENPCMQIFRGQRPRWWSGFSWKFSFVKIQLVKPRAVAESLILKMRNFRKLKISEVFGLCCSSQWQLSRV